MKKTNTFLQQEITEDGTAILMRVGKLDDLLNNNNAKKRLQ